MTTLETRQGTGHFTKKWQLNLYRWKQNALWILQPPQPLNPTGPGSNRPISVTRSISFTLITWHWNWRTEQLIMNHLYRGWLGYRGDDILANYNRKSINMISHHSGIRISAKEHVFHGMSLVGFDRSPEEWQIWGDSDGQANRSWFSASIFFQLKRWVLGMCDSCRMGLAVFFFILFPDEDITFEILYNCLTGNAPKMEEDELQAKFLKAKNPWAESHKTTSPFNI